MACCAMMAMLLGALFGLTRRFGQGRMRQRPQRWRGLGGRI